MKKGEKKLKEQLNEARIISLVGQARYAEQKKSELQTKYHEGLGRKPR